MATPGKSQDYDLMKTSAKFRIAAGLLLLAAVGGSLAFLPTQQYLGRMLGSVRAAGYWGPVLLAVAYVAACVLFVPGSILTLGAGFLFGPLVGTATVSVASVLGATAAFLVGRTLARSWIEQKVTAHPKFHAIDRAVGRQGFKIVLLTRLSPVFPFNLLNYAFGLTDVTLRDYFLASWIGMFPGTLMYVYLGSAAKNLTDLATGQVEGGVAGQVLFGVGLVVTVVVTVFVTRLAKRALDEAVPQTEADQPVAMPGGTNA